MIRLVLSYLLSLVTFINLSYAQDMMVRMRAINIMPDEAGTPTVVGGDVSLLPPTILLQYHHQFGKFKPYIGAGLNYTFFYGADPGAHKGISYDNSFGWAAQVGADYDIGNNFFINADLKRIALSTDVKVDLYAGGSVEAKVDINPFVAGLGIGYRF